MSRITDEVLSEIQDLVANGPASLSPSEELALFVSDVHVRKELAVEHGIVVNPPNRSRSCYEVYKVGIADESPVKDKAKRLKDKADRVNEKAKRFTGGNNSSWYQPVCYKDFMDVLLANVSHVVYVGGPTGSGKSFMVKKFCEEVGRKMFRVNCEPTMDSASFFGERTASIDGETGQSYIHFQDGPVVQAMLEGLNEDGDEVGEPGVLYIDEAPAMPSHISIALNRLLEDLAGNRREVCLTEDGGRVVKSHSGFRIVLSGNTFCRGHRNMSDMLYVSQGDALDYSMLNRISVSFVLGYDRGIERKILKEMIGDDSVTMVLLKYRDAIRGFAKSGEIQSSLSTRQLVNIARMYEVFRDITKAVYYSVFEWLSDDELAIFNEQALAVFGVDILSEYRSREMDME